MTRTSKASSGLTRYVGCLTPAEIAEGINAAARNSARLAADARLLLDSGRAPGAAALAVLAVEEMGKIKHLRQLAIAKSEAEIKACWKDLRTHTEKNEQWILPGLVQQGARKLEDLIPVIDRNSNHRGIIEDIKQLATYTDRYGSGSWSEPLEAISIEVATQIVVAAESLSQSAGGSSERDIQVWIHHMGESASLPLPEALLCFANWYAQLQAEGLKPPGRNPAVDFIMGSWESGVETDER